MFHSSQRNDEIHINSSEPKKRHQFDMFCSLSSRGKNVSLCEYLSRKKVLQLNIMKIWTKEYCSITRNI